MGVVASYQTRNSVEDSDATASLPKTIGRIRSEWANMMIRKISVVLANGNFESARNYIAELERMGMRYSPDDDVDVDLDSYLSEVFPDDARMCNLLEKRLGVVTIAQLLNTSREHLAAVKNIGPRQVERLVEFCRAWFGRRTDHAGRDVTDLPGLWCEDDL
jgi:hypothetical protein